MKTVITALCFLLFATAAFAQVGGSALSNEPQILRLPSHPQHASTVAMAPEQTLLISSGYVMATGERPLWEFAVLKPVVPLGDTARLLRQEHATAKKATKVWEN